MTSSDQMTVFRGVSKFQIGRSVYRFTPVICQSDIQIKFLLRFDKMGVNLEAAIRFILTAIVVSNTMDLAERQLQALRAFLNTFRHNIFKVTSKLIILYSAGTYIVPEGRFELTKIVKSGHSEMVNSNKPFRSNSNIKIQNFNEFNGQFNTILIPHTTTWEQHLFIAITFQFMF